MMPHPYVAICILNYKAPERTLRALESLQVLNYPASSYEIHVIDNASEDGSLDKIREAFPHIALHQNLANLGYSGGYNAVLKPLLATRDDIDAVWILNNDVKVDPEALQALVQVHQLYPKALIGSALFYESGQFQRLGSYLSGLKTKLKDYPLARVEDGGVVESLCGASWLLPKTAFDEIGFLDESYFLYFEDNDYCFRARKASWECRVAKRSIVYHEESATTKQFPKLIQYYFHRNRLIFLKRFLHPMAFAWVWFYTQFRFWRANLKREENTALKLAIADFQQGVMGQCPHPELN